MNDHEIIELYWQRSETAISATDKKYGKYCHTISYNILHNSEDASECVNDTYLKAWDSMPPKRPEKLAEPIAQQIQAIRRGKARLRADRACAVRAGGLHTVRRWRGAGF